MIGEEDAPSTYEYENHFKILPVINNWDIDPQRIKNGKKVGPNFIYNSETNDAWMTKKDLKKWLSLNKDKLGKI